MQIFWDIVAFVGLFAMMAVCYHGMSRIMDKNAKATLIGRQGGNEDAA